MVFADHVGILGGGQLGRMLIASASRMGIVVSVLDADPEAPAKQISNHSGHRHAPYNDANEILAFAKDVDILTVEIEHVNADALELVEQKLSKEGGKSGRGVKVRPSSSIIRVIQDKYLQHAHLHTNDIPVAPFAALDPDYLKKAICAQIELLGLPMMLKSRTFAYDGRGNYLLNSVEDIDQALSALHVSDGSHQLYAERLVPFLAEAAVMVVRTSSGQILSYPAVETIHRHNICHLVYAPPRSFRSDTAVRAQLLAEKAVTALGSGAVGIFGVEMFVLSNGDLLVNEIAPRPHNSGHYTIEACATSQYDNHLRAILDLPLGSTEMIVSHALMLNILGNSDDFGDLHHLKMASLNVPGATLHMYGKAACRSGRKVGHITIVSRNAASMDSGLNALLRTLPPAYWAASRPSTRPLIDEQRPPPSVSIIMGSDSDLKIMSRAAEMLELFAVPFEISIVSAHRTPHLMVDFATSARSKAVQIIIAGAGGAAHLPGMVASMTTLPVIGVPIKATCLDGIDSLHSIVQMPRGVPVATVAIDNAANAALLAIRILAVQDVSMSRRLAEYVKEIAQEVHTKRQRLSEQGWKQYQIA